MAAVTVLMPAYNAAATIAAAIADVLAQSFADLELLVVDDGSTDATPDVLAAVGDPRLRVVTNTSNRGLVASLNRGLGEASGDLVARLDADDRCAPGRLALQVAALGAHPDNVLCATDYRRVRPGGPLADDRRVPATHAALAVAMFTGNRLCHSSVMFRRDAAIGLGGYDAAWFPVEDYDLWLRMLDVGRYVHVPEVCVDYTENPEGISQSRRGEQAAIHRRRADRYVAGLASSEAPTRSRRGPIATERAALAGLRTRLRAHGIPTAGLADAARPVLLGRMAALPRWRRHLAVAMAWRDLQP